MLLNRARVDAYPHRHASLYALLYDGPVVAVGDQGHRRAPENLFEALQCLGAVNGNAYEVGAGGVELVDLSDGSLYVAGIGLGHGLNGHLGAASDGHAADDYLTAGDRAFLYRCLCHTTPVLF